jgi:bifunctional UDP-N-acetylglucosamine pyrophosphorylase/glucosamine-1-phosphate N-acetyltransferase
MTRAPSPEPCCNWSDSINISAMPSKLSTRATFAIVIMAAGKGTRLRSKRAKVLHHIGGLPLVEHVVRAAAQIVPASHIYVIIGHQAEAVRSVLQHTGVNFVLQGEQRGTGHAIISARSAIKDYSDVLVLSGDAPLIRPQTIAELRDFHLAQRAAMTILTAQPSDPTGYGRVLRKGKTALVTEIVEHKALKRSQLKSPEINSGIYAFHVPDLLPQLARLSTDNAHSEYYLTDVAGLLCKARKKVVALKADDIYEVLGANTIREMMELDAEMRRKKADALMASGVTIFRPETCVIDSSVEVGPDTVIEPFVQLLGNTRVGEDCRIRSYSVVSDSTIASAVTVKPGCILDQAQVASGAILGPYSHLRPGSDIGEGAHVGNFVETKKVKLGKGSKANHLTYLGDAEIGAGVNIGAGTITCNYDGVNKHTTSIGDGAFIGSDTTLVAPVVVGPGSYVGAGSCITQEVPPDSLALSRPPQVTKEGWAKKKREERAASRAKS